MHRNSCNPSEKKRVFLFAKICIRTNNAIRWNVSLEREGKKKEKKEWKLFKTKETRITSEHFAEASAARTWPIYRRQWPRRRILQLTNNFWTFTLACVSTRGISKRWFSTIPGGTRRRSGSRIYCRSDNGVAIREINGRERARKNLFRLIGSWRGKNLFHPDKLIGRTTPFVRNWIIHEIPADLLSSVSVAQFSFSRGNDFSFFFLPTRCVEMASWEKLCTQVPN